MDKQRNKFSGAFKAQVTLEALKSIKTINQIAAQRLGAVVPGANTAKNDGLAAPQSRGFVDRTRVETPTIERNGPKHEKPRM